MKIFSVLPALVADVQAVGKDHTNTFHKYKYRAVDDLMAALHPLLGKHGVSVIPQYTDIQVTPLAGKECRVTLKLSLNWVASDGSSLTTVTYGEGIDNGDKATYKAMAGAVKYAILQTLMVPTEETRGKQDPESDPGTDEPKRTRSKKTDGGTPPKTNGGSHPQAQVIPFAPSAGGPAVSAPASSTGEPSTETQLMLSLIAGCDTKEKLNALRQEVRTWVQARDSKDPERKMVVDNFTARQSALGA